LLGAEIERVLEGRAPELSRSQPLPALNRALAPCPQPQNR
jgi:hypothetical protein